MRGVLLLSALLLVTCRAAVDVTLEGRTSPRSSLDANGTEPTVLSPTVDVTPDHNVTVVRVLLKGPNGGRILHGFLAAFSVITVSEVGDKTFFIAAIMAMQLSRVATYLGAMVALLVMTAISACLGLASTILPHLYTHYACAVLFALFGLKMLKDGYSMTKTGSHEEFNDAQKMVSSKSGGGEVDVEQQYDARNGKRHKSSLPVCAVFLQALTLTFLAEWGDRSQLATIALAAEEDPAAVTAGAAVGHAACTLLAVLGGRMVSQRISVRTVTIIGGVIFLAFALFAVIHGPS